jgi:hypothetical protein
VSIDGSGGNVASPAFAFQLEAGPVFGAAVATATVSAPGVGGV